LARLEWVEKPIPSKPKKNLEVAEKETKQSKKQRRNDL